MNSSRISSRISFRTAPLVMTRISHSLLKLQAQQAPALQKRALSTSSGMRGPDSLPAASIWFWRAVYVATGVGAVGACTAYATNPEPVAAGVRAARAALNDKIRYFAAPSREKLLPDQVESYPGAAAVRTLVVELDGTLVHSSYTRSGGWRVSKRPGAEAFLAYMASFYEVVIFTSRLNSYADPILDTLDPYGMYISHRLYRAETHYKRGVHIKDLGKLNRELSRVVVVDYDLKNVSMQAENAIILPQWKGDDANDSALLDLIPFLESVVKSDSSDLRDDVAILKDKPLTEGVAEHGALVNSRAEQMRQRSIFGVSGQGEADRAPPPPEGGEEEEESKGAVWGSLSSKRVFQGR